MLPVNEFRMKKKLRYTSAALLIVWILGFFMLELSSSVHSVLWIATLLLAFPVLWLNVHGNFVSRH